MKQILSRFFGSTQRAQHALETSSLSDYGPGVAEDASPRQPLPQGSTSKAKSTCLVIRHKNPDYASSSEFHFLESYVDCQIKKVFGGAIVHSSEKLDVTIRGASFLSDVGLSVLDLSEVQYILWFGDDRTLVTRETLSRMKARIDRGAAAVAPCRLDRLLGITSTLVPRTLRQYEELEKELIGKRGGWTQPSPGLVSLVTVEAFEDLLAERSFEELVNDCELIQSLVRRPDFYIDGICHPFADYYGQGREDVIPFVPTQCRDVLEVGCARGATGKLLQERLGCKVTGVEQNPEVAAEASKHLFKVIVGDIESVSIFEKFDAIVATELFEHLLHPVEFLVKMKALLRPGGVIVLTTPNVGHWSIVEDILQGRWDYVPMGLLCYTHVRFFTRATLEDLIERAGFSSYEITAQTTELPERFSTLASNWTIDQENLKALGFYVVIRA